MKEGLKHVCINHPNRPPVVNIGTEQKPINVCWECYLGAEGFTHKFEMKPEVFYLRVKHENI